MLDDSFEAAQQLRILETVSDPGGAINDDRVGFAGDTLWVLDGATDNCPARLLPGQSDAAWIAEAFSQALHDLAPGFEGPLFDLAAVATERVAKAFAAESLLSPPDRSHHPSAAGLILRLRNGMAEMLGMGDCVALIKRPGEQTRLCGADPDRLGDRKAIARVRQFAAEQGLSWEEARARSQPESSRGRAKMNVPGGYSVFSIDMAPESLVHQERVEMPKGTRLLVMSDGFARLDEIFGVYSREALLDAAFAKGLQALTHELRALEDGDSACDRFPRMKARDDASALLACAV